MRKTHGRTRRVATPEASSSLHRRELEKAETRRLILETASGRKTKSEEFGYGDDEFAPWTLGATM